MLMKSREGATTRVGGCGQAVDGRLVFRASLKKGQAVNECMKEGGLRHHAFAGRAAGGRREQRASRYSRCTATERAVGRRREQHSPLLAPPLRSMAHQEECLAPSHVATHTGGAAGGHLFLAKLHSPSRVLWYSSMSLCVELWSAGRTPGVVLHIHLREDRRHGRI